MGYLVTGSPFSLPALTLPFNIDLPNISPGARLWIDNESGYVFTFSLGGRAPDLCPANYGRTLPLDGGSTRFEILSIIGSGSGSLSSNLFLYVITPDQKDLMDSSRQPISRYPTAQNYGYQIRAPNGGVVSTSQKSTLTSVPLPLAFQLDMLDFSNVIFYEDWSWPNGASGTTYQKDITGATSICGINYGYNFVGGGAGYTAMTFRNFGVTRQPASIGAGATSSTTTVMPPLMPQFPFVINNAGIEMVAYTFQNLSTSVGTNVDSYVVFLLNPLIAIKIHTSGTTLTTTTIDVTFIQVSSGATQSATFTAPVAGVGLSTNAAVRVAIKAILNSIGTYDIYCSYYGGTGASFYPTKAAYVFVASLSSATFLTAMTPNLAPGFSAMVVLGTGTTVLATSGFDLGFNTIRSAGGLRGPCLQINIP